MRIVSAVLVSLLSMPAAPAAPHTQRVGVMDFENAGPDKAADWLGIGIAQSLSEELGQVLATVERAGLDSVLRELHFSRSSDALAATAGKMGRMLGADTLILGNFFKGQDKILINARVVNVETAEIRAATSVNGDYKDLYKLEDELSQRLIEAIRGSDAARDRAKLRFVPERNLDAFKAFSDGVYFYRQDFLPDALRLFEQALQIAPNYIEAQYYRGLVLEQQNRWDEAIAAFKATLPAADSPQQMIWKWDAPASGERADRGWLTISDLTELNPQREALRRSTRASLEKRFAYMERHAKSTILHFVDPSHHSSQQIEIPDKHIQPDAALSNEGFTLLFSIDAPPRQAPTAFTLYGVGAADKAARWHIDIGRYGTQLPAVGMVNNSVYVFYPASRRLTVLDDQTNRIRWNRDNVDFDRNEPPHVRKTATHGDIVILKSPSAILAVGVQDGVDAWKIEPHGSFTFTLTGHELILFEFGRAVSIVDLETGKAKTTVAVAQATRSLDIPHFGSINVAQATIQNGTVYFQSKTEELYAVALDDAAKDQPVRWHVPLKTSLESILVDGNRIFAGTRTGDFVIIDALTGAVSAPVNIAAKDLRIDHAGADIVVASSERALYGLDARTGARRWEYPDAFADKETAFSHGIAIARTSETQTAFVDAQTGALLWNLAAGRKARIHVLVDTIIVMDEGGIREYKVQSPGEEWNVSYAQVLIELANALISKGDLKEAAAAAAKLPRDLDSPSVHAMRARLADAREDRRTALIELAALAGTAGRDSQSGQKAIAELKQNHRLLWTEPVEAGVGGALTPVGGKLINVDLTIQQDSRIAAYDPANGSVAWRQPGERFSHAAVDARTNRAWYVTGDAKDPAAVALFELNLEFGERSNIVRWTQPRAVGLAAAAYSQERLFVFSVSPDFPGGKETVYVECFTTSGSRLWGKTHEFTANIIEAPYAAGVFAAQGDVLVYSTGYELWTVKADDGSVLDQHRENALISRLALKNDAPFVVMTAGTEILTYDAGQNMISDRRPFPHIEKLVELKMTGDRLWALRDDATLLEIDRAGKTVAEHSLPWLPASFSIDGDRLYALTSDGFAYAMQL